MNARNVKPRSLGEAVQFCCAVRGREERGGVRGKGFIMGRGEEKQDEGKVTRSGREREERGSKVRDKEM